MVANVRKILSRMRNNPRDWRIEDLITLADAFGIDYRQRGSHVIFRSPLGGLHTVPAARPIKPVYIPRFLGLIDEGGAK